MIKDTKRLCASALALSLLTSPALALADAAGLAMNMSYITPSQSEQTGAADRNLLDIFSLLLTSTPASAPTSTQAPLPSPARVPTPSPTPLPTPTRPPAASPLPDYATDLRIDMERAVTVTDICYIADFAYLQTVNLDTIGYLVQEGTSINLPVVQNRQGSDYTKNSFNNSRTPKGTVFVDAGDSPTFGGAVNYIYGSKLKKAGDFFSLDQYQEQEYYVQHPNMRLLTPYADYQVEFFAGVSSTMSAPEEWRVELSQEDANSPDGFNSLIQKLREQSTFQCNESALPEADDKLLVLVAYQGFATGKCYVLYGRMRPILYATAQVKDAAKLEMDSIPTGNGYIQVANIGSFMVYAQNDAIWTKMRYESTTPRSFRNFGQGGCGPTAVAMAIANLVPKEELPRLAGYASNLLGFSFCSSSVNRFFCTHGHAQYHLKTPDEFLRYLPIAFASFATGNNLWGIQSRNPTIQGTNMRFLNYIAAIYEIEVTATRDVNAVIERLKQGDCMVVSCTTKGGPFTDRGHYVVLAGVDEEYLYVLDPFRRDNYNKWDRRKYVEIVVPGVVRIKLENAAQCCLSPLYIFQRKTEE